MPANIDVDRTTASKCLETMASAEKEEEEETRELLLLDREIPLLAAGDTGHRQRASLSSNSQSTASDRKQPGSSSHDGSSRTSRCLAVEQAYVHDVYREISSEGGASSPVRSHIKDFLTQDLDYGSLLIDIGCGDGKYLNLNAGIFALGVERCAHWFTGATYQPGVKGHRKQFQSDTLQGDMLTLPARDEVFDGALCCGVLHHLSTTERRIYALREIARLLRTGGKVLISVWAFEGREQLASQDVLIKWNGSNQAKERAKSRQTDSSYSDTDDSCTTSSLSTTANYVNRRPAYESCNSPNSEFVTCYSFVKRALQECNLLPAHFSTYHSSFRASKTTGRDQSRNVSPFSALDEDVPIELPGLDCGQNFDKGSGPLCDSGTFREPKNSSKGSAGVLDSKSDRFSRTDSIKEHYGSLVSLIKDKLSTIKDVKSFVPRKNVVEKPRDSLEHRFSLPVIPSFRRSSLLERFTSNMPVMKEDSFEDRNSADQGDMFDDLKNSMQERADIEERLVEEQDQLTELSPKKSSKCDKDYLIKKYNAYRNASRDSWTKGLQKSLSSDSLSSKSLSKQLSTNTESTTGTGTSFSTTSTSGRSNKLVAYYSMPELRSLAHWSSDEAANQLRIPRVDITDLHPITFLRRQKKDKPVVQRDDSQDTQAAISDIGSSLLSLENRNQGYINYVPRVDITEPCAVTKGDKHGAHVENGQEMYSSIDEIGAHLASLAARPNQKTKCTTYTTPAHFAVHKEALVMKSKLQLNLPQSRTILLTAQEREDAKKTQRSLSVEYKVRTSPNYPQQRRRFSASPSLYVQRPFAQFIMPQPQQHETHPSVDSEESFITIIPANRSYRGSVDLIENDDSYVDDVMLDLEHLSSTSSSAADDDGALCEQLATNVQAGSSEQTSIEGMTASTRSVASIESSKTPTMSQASTPSPPDNLHRFFHLFKAGELEELIGGHVHDLQIVRSYFSEHATSWCVVAEKIDYWV
ncbi:Alkylated DNA repair protein alkB -like protein 8 [Halotydeus destructor]|nr:Alkylated DNA repair protein alkB -like protein 8 [Halotydeus destructor]